MVRVQQIKIEDLTVTADLARTSHAKQFEERLQASIDAIGLAEPLKVAKVAGVKDSGPRYLIIDGVLRWRAICGLRASDSTRFQRVPAYVYEFDKRYEIRFQSDIYQDLLPSQLATLVEHLHQAEHISKSDIAQFIGVSTATLRNYTGLWRLVQRGGLFADVVALMDVGVLPASNPFAWLRLTKRGLRHVMETYLAGGLSAEAWISERLEEAKQGPIRSLPLKFVEAITGDLPPDCYLQDERVRAMKQELGLRRAAAKQRQTTRNVRPIIRHLDDVAHRTTDPVLRTAATALRAYLK